jgi:hypothetical protein
VSFRSGLLRVEFRLLVEDKVLFLLSLLDKFLDLGNFLGLPDELYLALPLDDLAPVNKSIFKLS